MRRVNVITYYVVFLLFIIVSVSVFAQERRPARRLQERAKPEVLYLTPEQEAEVLDYIREAYPERAKNLELWKDLRPEQYRKGLSRAFRRSFPPREFSSTIAKAKSPTKRSAFI